MSAFRWLLDQQFGDNLTKLEGCHHGPDSVGAGWSNTNLEHIKGADVIGTYWIHCLHSNVSMTADSTTFYLAIMCYISRLKFLKRELYVDSN